MADPRQHLVDRLTGALKVGLRPFAMAFGLISSSSCCLALLVGVPFLRQREIPFSPELIGRAGKDKQAGQAYSDQSGQSGPPFDPLDEAVNISCRSSQYRLVGQIATEIAGHVAGAGVAL